MDLIPMLGKKFNHLTVIERTGSNKYGALWKCVCDCGNEIILLGVDIRRSHWKSCGCRQAEGAGPKRTSTNRVLKQHYASYRNSKRAKQLGFELDLINFELICRRSCTYCNSPPQKRRIRYGSDYKGDLYAYDNLGGVDRLDNTKGYILGNCISCCGKCNIMKGNSTEKEFLEQVSNIYKNKFGS